MRERERERERERHRERERETETDRQTDRQTDTDREGGYIELIIKIKQNSAYGNHPDIKHRMVCKQPLPCFGHIGLVTVDVDIRLMARSLRMRTPSSNMSATLTGTSCAATPDQDQAIRRVWTKLTATYKSRSLRNLLHSLRNWPTTRTGGSLVVNWREKAR